VALVLPADAQVFLGRLTHLDPDALVRLRPGFSVPEGIGAERSRSPAPEGIGAERSRSPAPEGIGAESTARVVLWARLPWRVLVTREVADGSAPGDVTVGAAALLKAGGALPPARDAEWRWPLPPHAGTVLEEIPARRVREVAAAAAGTLREVTATGLAGRSVGVRVLREALLDHVPIVVETAAGRFEVPQRLVQAVVRMGFLGETEEPVRVRRAERWVGLAARYGSAWLPPPPGALTMRPGRPAGGPA
jgi:hypothetical protein